MNTTAELYHRAATADLTPAEFAGAAAAAFLDLRGGHTCEALAVSEKHRMAVLAVTDAPGRYAIARPRRLFPRAENSRRPFNLPQISD